MNILDFSFCTVLQLVREYGSDIHRRTGRHFTGGAEKICPENNNLP